MSHEKEVTALFSRHRTGGVGEKGMEIVIKRKYTGLPVGIKRNSLGRVGIIFVGKSSDSLVSDEFFSKGHFCNSARCFLESR